MKEANDDVAEVIYHVAEERTSVTCHREDSKISATTREFSKPSLTDAKGAGGVMWNVQDNYHAFLVCHHLQIIAGLPQCCLWLTINQEITEHPDAFQSKANHIISSF